MFNKKIRKFIDDHSLFEEKTLSLISPVICDIFVFQLINEEQIDAATTCRRISLWLDECVPGKHYHLGKKVGKPNSQSFQRIWFNHREYALMFRICFESVISDNLISEIRPRIKRYASSN